MFVDGVLVRCLLLCGVLSSPFVGPAVCGELCRVPNVGMLSNPTFVFCRWVYLCWTSATCTCMSLMSMMFCCVWVWLFVAAVVVAMIPL